MNDIENRNNIDKDVVEGLSKTGKTRTGAVSLGLDTFDGINKWYEDERAKMLEGKEKSLIKTNVEENEATAVPEGASKKQGSPETVQARKKDNNSSSVAQASERKENNKSKIQTEVRANQTSNGTYSKNNIDQTTEGNKAQRSNIKTNVKGKNNSNGTENQTSNETRSENSIADGSSIGRTAEGNRTHKSNIQTNVRGGNNNNVNQSHSKVQTNVKNQSADDSFASANAGDLEIDSATDANIENTPSASTGKGKTSLLVKAGVFTKNQSRASRTATVGLKTVNKVNRGFNKVYQKGKRIQQLSSGESNIQTNLKAVSNSAKKTVTKPVSMATKPIRRKIKTKVNQGIAKLAKLAFKALKAVGRLMIKMIGAILSSVPVSAILLVIIIVVVSVFSIFGGSMSDNQIEALKQYMQTTQQEYDDITVPFYEDGNIVENSIAGKGYINWKAALSVLQGLCGSDAQLKFDNAEKTLLNHWKAAELFEKIEDIEYKEKITVDGEEQEVTKTKKVITISGLNDYINWCNEHWENEIATFLKAKGVVPKTESLSDTQIEIINTLYNSDSFAEILGDEFLHSVSGNVIPGGGNGVLRYPTSSKSISAGFPNYSDGTYHGAIDFPVPVGTDVCAAEDGTVLVAGWYNQNDQSDGYGIYVALSHIIDGKTIITLYAHNSSVLVKVGDVVKRGQVIVKSGSTGNSTGPHVHFEVQLDHIWGTRVNPLAYLED